MKRLLCTLLLMHQLYSGIQAQSITGTWQSEKRTKTYQLVRLKNEWQAILVSNDDPAGKTGHVKMILYRKNPHKNTYKGIIYANDDEQQRPVSVRVIQKKKTILKLRISRMYILHAVIKWYRTDIN